MREQSAGDAHRRRRSLWHSVLLLTAMAALLAYCGWLVADWEGVLWSVIGGAVMLIMVRRAPPRVFLQALQARTLARWEAPALYKMLDGLCRSAGVAPAPLLCRIPQRLPLAMTIGGGSAAIIVTSEPLLQTMSGRQMRGILAHEIVHVRNGDLALMQLAMVVGMLTRVLAQLAFMLVFLAFFLRVVSTRGFPILPLLVLVVAPLGVNLLQLALSRTREAEADLEAAELTGDPCGLASALAKMRSQEQMLVRRWSPAVVPLRLLSLFRDHPATDERIRRLMAMLPLAKGGSAEHSPEEFRGRQYTGPGGDASGRFPALAQWERCAFRSDGLG
jgi:heat shock protein HtpX